MIECLVCQKSQAVPSQPPLQQAPELPQTSEPQVQRAPKKICGWINEKLLHIIYTYLVYGMNIYLPAILVSPGYEPFDPYPYWPEIYILNIFLSVFEIELISLITWLNNIFWTCFEPGLYRSFLPPNLEPWFLPVFLSQRGHIAGPPAAVAVQRAMVRSWDLEFCLGTLAKKGPWF